MGLLIFPILLSLELHCNFHNKFHILDERTLRECDGSGLQYDVSLRRHLRRAGECDIS